MVKTNNNQVAIMIRFDPDFKFRIDRVAVELGITSSEFIRRTVRDKLKSMDDALINHAIELLDDPAYMAKLKEKLNLNP